MGNLLIHNVYPECITCNSPIRNLEHLRRRTIAYPHLDLAVTSANKYYSLAQLEIENGINKSFDHMFGTLYKGLKSRNYYTFGYSCNEHSMPKTIFNSLVSANTLLLEVLLKIIVDYLLPIELNASCIECKREIDKIDKYVPIYKCRGSKKIIGAISIPLGGFYYYLRKDKIINEQYTFICYKCSNDVDYIIQE